MSPRQNPCSCTESTTRARSFTPNRSSRPSPTSRRTCCTSRILLLGKFHTFAVQMNVSLHKDSRRSLCSSVQSFFLKPYLRLSRQTRTCSDLKRSKFHLSDLIFCQIPVSFVSWTPHYKVMSRPAHNNFFIQRTIRVKPINRSNILYFQIVL